MKYFITAIAVALLVLPGLGFAGPVDINTADAQTLSTELNGIGISKAKAIVEYRDKHGPFQSAEDLSLVKGVGERTVELNRANIKVTRPKQK